MPGVYGRAIGKPYDYRVGVMVIAVQHLGVLAPEDQAGAPGRNGVGYAPAVLGPFVRILDRNMSNQKSGWCLHDVCLVLVVPAVAAGLDIIVTPLGALR